MILQNKEFFSFMTTNYIWQHLSWTWVSPAESPAASGTWCTNIIDLSILFLPLPLALSISPSIRVLIPQTAGAISGHLAMGPHSPRPFFISPAWDSLAPDLHTASKLVAPISSISCGEKTQSIYEFGNHFVLTPSFPRFRLEPHSMNKVPFTLASHEFGPFASQSFWADGFRVIRA